MGLQEDLTAKIRGLHPFDPDAARSVGEWFEGHFRFKMNRTPPGQKRTKELADKLWWFLMNADSEAAVAEIFLVWKELQPRLPDLVRYFTDEGSALAPPAFVRVGSNTYLNPVGLSKATLTSLIERMEALFKSLQGWRRGALSGGVTTVFAGPDAFRGTATGTYRSQDDHLYVRAVPKLLRSKAAEYVIVHELGHRYEYKHRLPTDFDQPGWWTTRYSRQEGEAFAELFATGQFPEAAARAGIASELLLRFEEVMAGGSPEGRVAARWIFCSGRRNG